MYTNNSCTFQNKSVKYFRLRAVQTASTLRPVSYSMDNESLFPRIKRPVSGDNNSPSTSVKFLTRICTSTPKYASVT